MPPEERNEGYLWDMLDASKTVVRMVAGKTFEDYGRDRMLQLAVERAVEIIGEAARRVTDEFKQGHAEIPWSAIVAQRHILAHDYNKIIQDRIWRVATIHVPDLIGLLEPLVESLPGPGAPTTPETPSPREDPAS